MVEVIRGVHEVEKLVDGEDELIRRIKPGEYAGHVSDFQGKDFFEAQVETGSPLQVSKALEVAQDTLDVLPLHYQLDNVEIFHKENQAFARVQVSAVENNELQRDFTVSLDEDRETNAQQIKLEVGKLGLE